VRANNDPDQQVTLKTSEDGRFTFTAVPRGKYTLAAEYRDFEQMYRQDGPFSTGIATGPGIDSEHIEFVYSMPASLSVQLVDEEGEPVREAELTLFRRHVESGRAVISIERATQMYANGLHRFPRVAPGVYLVGAQGRPWYAQNRQEVSGPKAEEQTAMPNEMDVVYPMTYYPNTSDPEGARSISVREGESARIQIVMRPVHAARISIHGPGFDRDGERNIGVIPNATLMTFGPGGTAFQAQMSSGMMEHLTLTGVSPGRHILIFTRPMNNGRPDQEQDQQSAEINVTGDVSLNIADLPHTGLSGRVLVPEALPPRPNLLLLLRDLQNSTGSMAEISKDGSFVLNNVLSTGHYEILLANTPELYIQSLSASGASYIDGRLELESGKSVQLTVRIAKGMVKADGVAVTRGKPTPGALVLLVPEDRSFVGDFPRDQSDSDGTFTLNGVHPGRYRLVAIDDGQELEYRNPAVMKQYLANAQLFEFPANDGASLQAEVQKRVR
jgi:hypothetical protein